MSYEQQALRKQKILYNSAHDYNRIRGQLIENGEKVTLTSAAITIRGPDSDTALVSAAAMTVSGTLAYYELDTTTVATWPIAENYRAEITFTMNNGSYTVPPQIYLFDIVRWWLHLPVGYDQLVAYDGAIQGMTNGDDDDLSRLIESCRDDFQIMIESKVVKDGGLMENMILDQSKVAVPFRLYILAQLWFSKGDKDRYEEYKARFRTMFDAAMSTMRFDTDQDGQVEAEMGGIQEVRLVT
jgi:hypothetical protein